MASSLRNKVVVITGASSGIGRATAHAFAKKGATLVLAARRKAALAEARRECERLGGRAIIVPTDVRSAKAVKALCDKAVDAYDGVDIWINNAAVSLFGRFEETPREDFERVLETNILGTVHGAREAIRLFREQGRGHLINISSIVGTLGQPYASAYVTSKWAIRGLTECLRMEMQDEPSIAVSGVLPASIDTPIFQHAGNFFGRPVKAMDPVYPPDQVAAAIISLARSPRREIYVGNSGRIAAALRTLLPGPAEALIARQVASDHFSAALPVPATHGNIFEPDSGSGATRGGWLAKRQVPARRPNIGAIVAVAGIAATLLPLGHYAYQRWRTS